MKKKFKKVVEAIHEMYILFSNLGGFSIGWGICHKSWTIIIIGIILVIISLFSILLHHKWLKKNKG